MPTRPCLRSAGARRTLSRRGWRGVTTGRRCPSPAAPPLGIWHSPLSRAAATAQAIAAAQPATVALHSTDGLTEIAQGEWEGQPHQEVRTRWAAELAAWRRSPLTDHAPGGEELAVAAARVATAIEQVTLALASSSADTDQSSAAPAGAAERFDRVPGYRAPGLPTTGPAEPWAALVAHDGIFRLTLMTLLGVPLERFWSFPFNLCAITVVALSEGTATLRAHNLSEHLALLTPEARAAAGTHADRPGAL